MAASDLELNRRGAEFTSFFDEISYELCTYSAIFSLYPEANVATLSHTVYVLESYEMLRGNAAC